MCFREKAERRRTSPFSAAARYAAMQMPNDWRAALDRLVDGTWRCLVVLGGVDVGKSTFASHLLDGLSRRGRPATLLDADLGQKMIGPPACVTMGATEPDGALRLRRICFVGETNPVPVTAGVIAAVARLSSGDMADRMVVNTSGLITGPGISLKRSKLDVLAPDRVVVLGEAAGMETILRPLRPDRVLRLAVPVEMRRKSQTFREAARALSLGDALKGARELTLSGVPVDDLTPPRDPLAPGLRRLCGLADENGEDLGIGLVSADTLEHQPKVLTAVDPARVRRLRVGMPAWPAAFRVA